MGQTRLAASLYLALPARSTAKSSGMDAPTHTASMCHSGSLSNH